MRASEGSMHQSSPRTSYPVSDARVASAKLAPFAKRVRGTGGICAAASATRRLVDMYCKEGKEKLPKSWGDSSPADESNI